LLGTMQSVTALTVRIVYQLMKGMSKLACGCKLLALKP